MRWFKRLVPLFRDQGIAPELRHVGRQSERIGDDPPCAAPDVANCAACADILPEDELVIDRIPHADMAQGLLGAAPIRRVLGIGDGEFLDAPVGQCRLETGELAVDFQGRAMGRNDDDTAPRVECAVAAGQALGSEVEHELLVGRQNS